MSAADPLRAPNAIAPLEIELKLDAPAGLSDASLESALRELGYEPAAPQRHEQRDRYLDTEALDLVRRGIGLRLRERDGRRWLGLKLRGEGPERGGLWRRIEIEVELPRDAAAPGRASELPGPVRQRVEPFACLRPLGEIARLATVRTERVLHDRSSDARALLCADRVRIEGGARHARFGEIEIEDVSLGETELGALSLALRERLGLRPSTSDKLGRALKLLGVEVPALVQPAPTAEDPLRRAACLVLSRHLEALRTAEPIAREGIDPEGVHQMRVASRRLRAALRLFADAWPPGRLDPLERFARRSGSVLGPVRDLDVMLAELPQRAREVPHALAAELEPLAALLERRQDRERTRLLRFLEAPARLRPLERIEAFLERAGRTRPRGVAGRPLGESAGALLEAAAERVWKRGERVGRRSPTPELHRVRIAVKRLRYTAESLAPLYGDALDAWLRRMRDLQDVLGAFNDAGVAAARLSDWLDTREGRRLPRRTLVAAGALISSYEQRGAEAREKFRKAWKRFARDKARRELAEIARSVGRG